MHTVWHEHGKCTRKNIRDLSDACCHASHDRIRLCRWPSHPWLHLWLRLSLEHFVLADDVRIAELVEIGKGRIPLRFLVHAQPLCDWNEHALPGVLWDQAAPANILLVVIAH